MRPARALIDLHALRSNYRLARELGGGKALAIIKADAYGHGAVRCAQALEDEADGFGVATIEEALELLRSDAAAAPQLASVQRALLALLRACCLDGGAIDTPDAGDNEDMAAAPPPYDFAGLACLVRRGSGAAALAAWCVRNGAALAASPAWAAAACAVWAAWADADGGGDAMGATADVDEPPPPCAGEAALRAAASAAGAAHS